MLGGLTALSIVAAPAALAQGWGHNHHEGWDGGHGHHHHHHDDDHVVVVPVPVPVPAAVPAAAPLPAALPPLAPLAAPPPGLQGAVLPPLQQVLPNAGFGQNPPQFFPLQGSNGYGVSSPLLFCGVDQANTCQLIAQQLSQITPGWSTATLNGPQGYGVYLTYQGSF
jgi:hypothetical protein